MQGPGLFDDAQHVGAQSGVERRYETESNDMTGGGETNRNDSGFTFPPPFFFPSLSFNPFLSL